MLFLSEYRDQADAEYSTDRNFTVTGAQTNEAPVRYTIKRLAERDETLDRIVALVTPKAKETALEHFSAAISADSPATDLTVIDIHDEVTTTDLLRKTLDALLPMTPSDSVIIETTGGLRNAVNALMLFARFLRCSGINIDFSTYADLGAKRVADTHETDDLVELLDATNLFAESANPHPLVKAMKHADIPHKEVFTEAIVKFYDAMLCCKVSSLDEVMKNLRMAFEDVINAEYSAHDATALVFRDLVSEIVRTKLAFIYADEYLKPLVKWCCNNGYLQQAVTVLVEKVLSYYPDHSGEKGKPARYKTEFGKKIGNKKYYEMLNLRHNFNHADAKKIDATAEQIKENVLSVIRQLEK
jgi:hypothetical protein